MGSVRSLAGGFLSDEFEVGDVKIAWEESVNERMIAVIQRKMDQGVKFYETAPNTQTERPMLRNVSELRGRELFVGDEDFEQLWAEGRVGFFASLRSAIQTRLLRRITDAGEAARSHTWAMRQMQGG